MIDLSKYNDVGKAILRLGLSMVFLWFGFQQIINTSNWIGFLPDFILNSSLNPELFVKFNGGLELFLGSLLLIGLFTRISSGILGLHLLGIAFTIGMTSTGVRDFGLAIASLSIAFMIPGKWSLDGFFVNKIKGKPEMKKKFFVIIGLITLVLLLTTIGLLLGLSESSTLNEVGPGNNAGSTGQTVVLDMNEIEKHNSANNCWLLIEGKVYDVTPFINSHPGGANEIIPNCGKDATADYQTQGGEGEHSQNARDMLNGYYLGDLGTTIQEGTFSQGTDGAGSDGGSTAGTDGTSGTEGDDYDDEYEEEDNEYDDD